MKRVEVFLIFFLFLVSGFAHAQSSDVLEGLDVEVSEISMGAAKNANSFERFFESLRLSFTSDDEKAEIILEYAEERKAESDYFLSSGDVEKSQKLRDEMDSLLVEVGEEVDVLPEDSRKVLHLRKRLSRFDDSENVRNVDRRLAALEKKIISSIASERGISVEEVKSQFEKLREEKSVVAHISDRTVVTVRYAGSFDFENNFDRRKLASFVKDKMALGEDVEIKYESVRLAPSDSVFKDENLIGGVDPNDDPQCGDGIVDSGEVCDDGSLNGRPNQCNIDCTGYTLPECGNGVTEKGESCDDGNSNEADECSSSCSLTFCGDAIIQAPNGGGFFEVCDDGSLNGELGQCNSQCTGIVDALCGNGIVELEEECDDGNDLDSDACTTSCMDAICGDSIVYTGQEECDDGSNGSQQCSSECELTFCGDAIIQDPNGQGNSEVCDDGSLNGELGQCNLECTGIVTDDDTDDSTCGRGKIRVCHIPPGNPDNEHTICIGAPALPAHLAHGDYEGECDDSEERSSRPTEMLKVKIKLSEDTSFVSVEYKLFIDSTDRGEIKRITIHETNSLTIEEIFNSISILKG